LLFQLCQPLAQLTLFVPSRRFVSNNRRNHAAARRIE
jgi:hypothetical protein